MGHGDGPRPKEAFHLLTSCSQRSSLKSPHQIVCKGLAAPYTVQQLLATAQIVLASETNITQTIDPERSTKEILVMVVWRMG